MKYVPWFLFIGLWVFCINEGLGQTSSQSQENLSSQQQEVSEKKTNFQQRSIYGRYDDSHKINVDIKNKVSNTILPPRKDFKDRIARSLGRY